MILDSGIPVWVKLTCDNGDHFSLQVSPQDIYQLNTGGDGLECPECGVSEFSKITIDGSSNENLTTLEEVRRR